MKLKLNITTILLAGILASSNLVTAQLGGLGNKIGNKVKNDKNDKKDDKTDNKTNSGLSCNELAEKGDALYNEANYKDAWTFYEQAENNNCLGTMDGQSRMNLNDCKKKVTVAPKTDADIKADELSGEMEGGKAYFRNSFFLTSNATQLIASEDIITRFVFKSPIAELLTADGLANETELSQYINIYINGKKLGTEVFDIPAEFLPSLAEVTYVDLPIQAGKSTLDGISESDLKTGQDMFLLTSIIPAMTMTTYIRGALNQGENNFKLKLEYGIGKKGAEMTSILSASEVSMKSDKAIFEKLIARAPKSIRPLLAAEKGEIAYSTSNYEVGTGSLTATMKLPNPPKYYNQKWCNSMSCDYDHGNLEFYAELDGEFLAAWSAVFWNEEYEKQTSFDFTLLNATDAEFADQSASFNDGLIWGKQQNAVIYKLVDRLYSGKIATGKHTLKIKCYSQQTVPLNTGANEDFNQWPSIAETEMTINVTGAGVQKMKAASTSKKLSHASGEWVAVDAHLKKAGPAENGVMLDIATQTTWKVEVNAFGVPLYRTCKANILYKTNDGEYRISEDNLIKCDYEGSGYSKPYIVTSLFTVFGSGMLDNFHYPVASNKVK